MCCSVDSYSAMVLHGPQGDNVHHHGLHHRLQGNLCSGTWSTSSPSFFTDLGVCRVVSLTYCHSSLPAAVAHQCFPLRPVVRGRGSGKRRRTEQVNAWLPSWYSGFWLL